MQPAANPRLAKEAAALSASGYDVTVLCGFMTHWALEADQALQNGARWECRYVGGTPGENKLQYFWTRLRYGVASRAAERFRSIRLFDTYSSGRNCRELQKAASRSKTDLFIAHGPAALLAAARAAAKQGAYLGYDAEDVNSGMSRYDEPRLFSDEIAERIEQKLLPMCDYVSAASPGIAEAYAAKYKAPVPTTILNVFPLELRPKSLPETHSDRPLQLFWFSQTIGATRGIEQALSAMAPLKQLEIELHLQGAWQPGFEPHLRQLADRLEIPQHRIISHPPAPLREVVANAARSDIGLALELNVSPNREICLTNKIFIYLLAGTAIAASDTPAQRNLMDGLPGVGCCFDQDNTTQLTNWFRRCYTDRSVLAEARKRSWIAGCEAYNWDREKIKFLGLVQDVFSNRPKAERRGRVR
jgi:hypothetical protein